MVWKLKLDKDTSHGAKPLVYIDMRNCNYTGAGLFDASRLLESPAADCGDRLALCVGYRPTPPASFGLPSVL